MNRKNGFTLIEILSSLVLISIAFILIYRTFFTVQNHILQISKEIKENEILYNFLNSFKSEIKKICDFENFEFDRKGIKFLCFLPENEYIVEINYQVIQSQEKGILLLRKQKNILNGYEFEIPVLENCQDIEFLFYGENGWEYNVEEGNFPEGIAIEVNYLDKEIFFPVFVYHRVKNEEK